MKFRQTDTQPVAAAKASFSPSTAYRIECDPRLNANRLPDLALLRAHFAPDPGRVPHVVVRLVPLDAYECLVGAAEMGVAA